MNSPVTATDALLGLASDMLGTDILVLVSHGGFLKANGGECLGELLNITFECCNVLRHMVSQEGLEVLQLGLAIILQLLLQLLCNDDPPAGKSPNLSRLFPDLTGPQHRLYPV